MYRNLECLLVSNYLKLILACDFTCVHMCFVFCPLPVNGQIYLSVFQTSWSLILYVFSMIVRSSLLWLMCFSKALRIMMRYMPSWELQWGNALENFSLVYIVKIGPMLLFSPRLVFPLTVIYVCWWSINISFWNLYLHVICKIVWTHSFNYDFC